MFDTQVYHNEYHKLRSSIDKLPLEYSRDLRTMLVNLDQLVLHILYEQVNCRQRRKTTRDYEQLLETYEQYRQNLEEQLVLAILSA